MNKTDFYILHLLRTKPRLGQKDIQTQAASDAQKNQTAIITKLTSAPGTHGAGPEAISYSQQQVPERERLLCTGGLQQEKFQEQTGIPDVLARYTDLNESQEGLAGSILTLEERNADLNESFGISTLDAQIFADRLTTLGNTIGVNQDSLKQYAKDLDGLTSGYINITNSVQDATIQQKNYTDGLLAGQRYLQQNLNLNKEKSSKISIHKGLYFLSDFFSLKIRPTDC